MGANGILGTINMTTFEYYACDPEAPEFQLEPLEHYYLWVGYDCGTYDFVWSDRADFILPIDVTYDLTSGVNWWTPMAPTSLDDLKSGLNAISGDILINSQDMGFLYRDSEGNWSGTLVSNSYAIEPGYMLKIKTQNSGSFSILGIPQGGCGSVGQAPGYYWLGYASPHALPIEEALGPNFWSEPGDTITDQDGNTATYDGSSWSGTLTTLQPGHGYIYLRQ